MALPSTSTQATLELLGKAVLSRPGAATWRLERKLAALLAYLALEGETPRSKIAGLLYPDSVETTARNNLRQVLRRLRAGAGTDLVEGNDALRLTQVLEVDAVGLELCAFAGDDATVLTYTGELLEGLDYEDCEDLTDWLLAKREAFKALRIAALERLSDAHEQGLEWRGALGYAEELVELDPVSEITHRRVMRLHYLNGDRGAALAAYARCCKLLERELGVAPLPETAALAALIETGGALGSTPRPGPHALPVSIQRPPVLIGREREWAALEAAWAAGQGIAVGGEAGMGKTRLTLEFVASKGKYALVQGRPGDEAVPYSTLARSLRQTLSDHPNLELQPWVRLELSRLMPALHAEVAPAILSDEGKLRFFEAMAAALEPLIHDGVRALVIEDVQFADDASLEAGQYLTTRFAAGALRGLSTFRPSELRLQTQAMVQQGLNAGQVALIGLQPLETAAMHTLLDGLGLALPAGLAALLNRHSGGNPLFALETLRSLIERGDLTRDLPERLPVPKRLEALIAGRLERLTPQAQRLARCAALGGTDFSVELARFVLETPIGELEGAMVELERAQLMTAERFGHDLIVEAVLNTMGSSVKRLLHRRCAEFLQASGDPLRVADHWLAGGEALNAVPQLLAGAERARAQYQLRVAAGAFGKAAGVLEDAGQPSAAFAAYKQQLEVLAAYDLGDERAAAVDKLLALARSSFERVIALTEHAHLLGQLGKGVEAERIAQDALALAETLNEPLLILDAVSSLATAVFVQRQRTRELIEIIRRARDLADSLKLLDRAAEYDSDLGVLYGQLDQRSQALEHHRRAVSSLRCSEQREQLVGALTNLAAALSDHGQPEAGLNVFAQAEAVLVELPDNAQRRLHLQTNRLATLTAAGRYRQALEQLEALEQLAAAYPDEIRLHIPRFKAELMVRLGAFDAARAAIEGALNHPQASLGSRIFAQIHRAETQVGADALRTLEDVETVVVGAGLRPLAVERARLCKVPWLPPEEGLGLVQHAQTVLRDFDHPPLELTVQLRLTQCLHRLGQVDSALEAARVVMENSKQTVPEMVYQGELRLTVAQVLIAARAPDARAQLQTMLDWLLETARNHVPDAYRAGFLGVNPHNRAILDLARAEGLEGVPEL